MQFFILLMKYKRLLLDNIFLIDNFIFLVFLDEPKCDNVNVHFGHWLNYCFSFLGIRINPHIDNCVFLRDATK